MPGLTRTARAGALLAGVALFSGLAAAQTQQRGARDRVDHPIAEFQGLDKITGRIIKFEVRVGETVQFGALQVTPRACVQRLTGDRQRMGFIEVDEITLRNEIRRLFGGWMFAASPGLNAVEHPIYDVWLDGCKGGNVPTATQGPAAGFQGDGELPEAGAAPARRVPPARQPPARAPAIQPGVPFDPTQIPAALIAQSRSIAKKSASAATASASIA